MLAMNVSPIPIGRPVIVAKGKQIRDAFAINPAQRSRIIKRRQFKHILALHQLVASLPQRAPVRGLGDEAVDALFLLRGGSASAPTA